MDYKSAVIEEIALEGLDGATLECLWKRLESRPNFQLKINPEAQKYIWNIVKRIADVSFYELPNPRPLPILRGLTDNFNGTSGLYEESVEGEEVYPFKMINQDGIIGSCSTFSSRLDVTKTVHSEDMSLEDVVERWGNKLTLVASQRARFMALLDKEYNPTFMFADSPLSYYLLEKVGRSRYSGAVSYGIDGLSTYFGFDPGKIFYLCKLGLKNGWIRKQALEFQDLSGKCKSVKVLHLTRFYKRFEGRYRLLLQQICDYLERKAHKRETLAALRTNLKFSEKTFKTAVFTNSHIVKRVTVPYREQFPDAKESEYTRKSDGKEKVVCCLEMVKHIKEYEAENEDEDDEDDDATSNSEGGTGNTGRIGHVFERTEMWQIYDYLCKNPGLTQRELEERNGMLYTQVRTYLKYLKLTNCVKSMYVQRKRQKVQEYYPMHVTADSVKQNSSSIMKMTQESNQVTTSGSEKDQTDGKKTKETSMQVDDDKKEESLATKDEVVTPGFSKETPEILATEITQRMKNAKVELKDKFLTPLQIRRMELILEIIEKGSGSMLRRSAVCSILRNIESEKGIDGTMDYKSFDRLVYKLIQMKKIKMYRAFLSNDKKKYVEFLCQPHVSLDNPQLKKMVREQQMKVTKIGKTDLAKVKLAHQHLARKHQGGHKVETAELSSLPKKSQEAILTIKSYRSKYQTADMVFDIRAAYDYGLAAKMKKAQMLHAMMFYLLYEYSGTETVIQDISNEAMLIEVPAKPSDENIGKATVTQTDSVEETSEGVSAEGSCTKESVDSPAADTADVQETSPYKEMTKEELTEIHLKELLDSMKSLPEPPVYKDEMSWKRYLSPLPYHPGFPKGWGLVSDILHSLPLQVFCSLIPVSYRIVGLKEVLNHPKWSLYPIILLPRKLVSQLLFSGKYPHSFYLVLENLNKMGLLSFGKRVGREKDQFFVYLHQRGSLIDTTSAKPGHIKVQITPDLPLINYHFKTEGDVDNYWCQLQEICLSTQLGKNSRACKAKDADFPDNVVRSYEDAARVFSPETVIDDGVRPGNQCGAGGLDSSFYGHRLPNWSLGVANALSWKKTSITTTVHDRNSEDINFDVSKSVNTRLPRILPLERLALVSGTGGRKEVVKVSKTKNVKGNKGGAGIKRKTKAEEVVVKKKAKREKTPVRQPKKQNKQPVLDEKDELAQKNMKSHRVSWNKFEDSILLICRVASAVISNSDFVLPVLWKDFRDILQKYNPNSVDKSTKACQRRITFVMKDAKTKINIAMFLAEALEDPYINEHYAKHKVTNFSPEASAKFKDLADMLVEKFSSTQLRTSQLPQTYGEFTNMNIKAVKMTTTSFLDFEEVTTVRDIAEGCLSNIVQCYLAQNDKQHRGFECYKLLKQYPNDLLTSVLKKMRIRNMITLIKWHERNKNRHSSIQCYKFSQKYNQKFLTKLPETLFADSLDILEKMLEQNSANKPFSLKYVPKGGYCATLISLFWNRIVNFKLFIPKELIVLDPSFQQSHVFGIVPIKKKTKSVPKPGTSNQDDVGGSYDEDMDVSQGEENDAEIPQGSKEKGQDDKGQDDKGQGDKGQDDKGPAAKQITDGETSDKKKDLENVELTFGKNSIVLEGMEKVNFTHPDGKVKLQTASRVLIAMRRSRLEQVETLAKYKFQDNFVIESCELGASVTPSNASPISSYLEELLPTSKMKKMYKDLTRIIPFQMDIDETIKENFNAEDQERAFSVYRYVDYHYEFGVTRCTLDNEFWKEDWYLRIVRQLEDLQVLIRVGFMRTRFVSLTYCRPWVAHAYRNNRGRVAQDDVQGFEVPPMEVRRKPQHPSQNASVAKETTKSTLGNNDIAETSETNSDDARSTTPTPEEQPSTDLSKSTSRSSKKLRAKDNQSDSLEEECPTPKTTYKKIRFLMLPWKKPEGGINKPVFQLLLENIMLKIISSPGISLNALITSYVPANQPFVKENLLDILEDIGAVEKICLKKEVKPSLFSKRSQYERVDCPRDEDIICYRPKENGINLVGRFTKYINSYQGGHLVQ